ncbi:hypothetical protein NA57DRAFT_57297 [Rhizodiscina lignyota]|uniref:Uncharacterized protein n=1 Tax=Rhizodiscina lignyota TaxID=1504668 RepID=A0A9P4IC81_9PEZI|nr:hypothetical protein NA57DRAFT_57297 [Rhizodiscina lignyota]
MRNAAMRIVSSLAPCRDSDAYLSLVRSRGGAAERGVLHIAIWRGDQTDALEKSLERKARVCQSLERFANSPRPLAAAHQDAHPGRRGYTLTGWSDSVPVCSRPRRSSSDIHGARQRWRGTARQRAEGLIYTCTSTGATSTALAGQQGSGIGVWQTQASRWCACSPRPGPGEEREIGQAFVGAGARPSPVSRARGGWALDSVRCVGARAGGVGRSASPICWRAPREVSAEPHPPSPRRAIAALPHVRSTTRSRMSTWRSRSPSRPHGGGSRWQPSAARRRTDSPTEHRTSRATKGRSPERVLQTRAADRRLAVACGVRVVLHSITGLKRLQVLPVQADNVEPWPAGPIETSGTARLRQSRAAPQRAIMARIAERNWRGSRKEAGAQNSSAGHASGDDLPQHHTRFRRAEFASVARQDKARQRARCCM